MGVVQQKNDSGETWVKSIWDFVDKAYKEVERLYLTFEIEPSDFEIFYKESPNRMTRIKEIEDEISYPMPMEDVEKLCGKWVKNWRGVFERRAKIKKGILSK